MRLKKLFCPFLALTLLVICLSTGVKAQEISAVVDDEIVSRATSQFTIDVPANGIRYASTQFPMEVGEVVTIRASYSPANVDINFGLIDSDSIFHYVTATDGSINYGLRITERGYYTFAVQNNSSVSVSVTGYVNY